MNAARKLLADRSSCLPLLLFLVQLLFLHGLVAAQPSFASAPTASPGLFTLDCTPSGTWASPKNTSAPGEPDAQRHCPDCIVPRGCGGSTVLAAQVPDPQTFAAPSFAEASGWITMAEQDDRLVRPSGTPRRGPRAPPLVL